MSGVFDNGGDVSIRRMRVGSIIMHCVHGRHVDPGRFDGEERGRRQTGSEGRRSRAYSERGSLDRGGSCGSDGEDGSDARYTDPEGFSDYRHRSSSGRRSRSSHGRATSLAYRAGYEPVRSSASAPSAVQGALDMYSNGDDRTSSNGHSHYSRSGREAANHRQPRTPRRSSSRGRPGCPRHRPQQHSNPIPPPPPIVVFLSATPSFTVPSIPGLYSSYGITSQPYMGEQHRGYISPVGTPTPSTSGVSYVTPQYSYSAPQASTSQQLVVHRKKKRGKQNGYFQ